MSKIIPKLISNYEIVIIFILSLFIVWPLFLPGYFSHHDDLQVMRIFEMRKCFGDLQIPCRWVPDMGFGNGFPLFNYYSVFPYYIGGLFSYILGFIGAAKVLFFIPLFFGGFSMYFLGKELFNKLGGVVSAVLYLYAPYRALDTYVRGAVAESFALFLIPLVFYFSLKLIKSDRYNVKYFLGTAISLGAFLTSHNIMTIMFLPVLLVWVIFWVLIEKKITNRIWFKSLFPLILSLVLGIGLAAFFILPAFMEKSLVRTDTLTRYDLDFRAHFVTVNQILFSRFWGYGAASPDHSDTISYQIGILNWILALAAFLVSLLFSLLYLIKIKKIDAKRIIFLNLFFFGIFLISLFMMHNKSAFVWEKIGILQYAQFPWRFLSLSIFSSSLLGGFLVTLFKGKIKIFIVILIISLTFILNWSYFHPGEYYFNLTDQEKLSGKLWEDQQKASILDYLPKGSIEPREAALNSPTLRSGLAEVRDYKNSSNRFEFKAYVSSNSKIEVPIFDFPNWQVYANNLLIPHDHINFLGRIQVDILPGNYLITGYFANTPVRTISNFITFISLIIIICVGIYGEKYKHKKN